MKEMEYKLQGYSFTDPEEYREAKREAESVDYIRTKTDLEDLNKVTKLYYKLADKQTFQSIIGYEFLKELQNKVLNGGIRTPDTIPWIRVGGRSSNSVIQPDKNSKYQKLAEEYRIRHRNSRIINIFMSIIIAAMILINLW
ncbi:MAG: hypothetical protein E7255_06575 [Lachnospiraceae bacterium]|jgi:hypothetical protein|nr:hypothetical protein [Lachnospiraceae bacterium]